MNDKLTKAKVQMILQSPFFASLVLSMQFVEDSSVPTACTDGKSIIYNPKFIDSLNKEEIVGLLVHEVLHVANLHHLRLQNRDAELFNIAADYTINELIIKAGFKLPEGGLLDSKYSNKSAEEIYDLLPKDSKKPKYGDFKAGKPKTESEKQEETQRVKTMVAKAATIARQQGKIPAGMDRFVEQLLAPVVNWREVLARFLTDRANSDYSWNRPNKRFYPTYLPSLQTIPMLGEIVLMVDTSGSIDLKLLNEFSAEVQDICTMMSKPLLVMYIDTKVASVQTFEPEDHIILKPKGGGGTDFRPGFTYLETNDISPACVIYFTDGECNSYPSEPDYPVLWAVYRNNNFIPKFGETINL
ncbi:MAG: DUF2201 family putative metallopeptidase [Bacteroidota bacterium]|jgi:predicted metal-dependent peptidase